MIPDPVLTKADFVRRYFNNEFGNRAPTWNTLKEFLASGYTGLVHIRNRVAGAPTWYDVPARDVVKKTEEVIAAGHNQLYFSGMCPTELTIIQGEVQRSINHLSLYYSCIPKPMRQSLIEGGIQVSGATAVVLLRSFMDASSYEWLDRLLDEYPDHVIEFTTLSRWWGTIPRRNTVFWEVRLY